MGRERTVRKASLFLMIGGVALFAVAAIIYATAPTELPLGAPGWFASASAHDDALMYAWICTGLGVMSVASGFRLSRTGRTLEAAVIENDASALGRGFSRGSGPRTSGGDAAARLAQLQQLRAQGLISDEELEEKRSAIIDGL
jgi:hypothetical protein